VTEVLIVEDETALAEPLAFLLQREGFEVRMAADGQEALAEFSKAEPDIVLLDLMLPGTEWHRGLQKHPLKVLCPSDYGHRP